MKFFRTEQIRAIDEATIAFEPISSINLMERAATQLTDVIAARYGGGVYMFAIFAGPGNNGGDALAVARMLNDRNENVAVWLVAPQGNLSPDCRQNLERLSKTNVPVTICDDSFSAPVLPSGAVVIDGLFGSGLSRPVTGLYATVIDFINGSGCKVVSIDVPSGLHGEKLWDPKVKSIVRATFTLTLQFPKLSLLLPENEEWVGGWEIIDIFLSEKAIEEQPTSYYFTDFDEIKSLIKPRRKFSHKGDYGRALLVAGSLGMAGASMLAARSALRSGVGLLTLFIPQCNNVIIQKSVPEAMTQPFGGDAYITEVPETAAYSAVGVGPGLGTRAETSVSLLQTIEKCASPMVLDADALNILAKKPEYLKRLPRGSVITPHPGEFSRLAGKGNSLEQLAKASAMAQEYGICVVLKGAHTAVCAPDGNCYFNSSGNPGMATGGSGDVLTGIILALLARGYNATDAARVAVYIHGLAGDIAVECYGQTAMTAGDIVDTLPRVWKQFERD